MNHSFSSRYAFWIRRLDLAIAFLSVIILAVSIYLVSHLKIKSDFRAMLPPNFPSVVELNRLEEKVTTIDNLVVLVGGQDWPALKRFVDDFVSQAQERLGKDIGRIEYNVSGLRDFYEKNKYLYIDYDDLKEIYQRLRRKIDHEKLKELPFYIDLGEEAPKFYTEDIEAKYRAKTGNYKNYRDGYFTNQDASLVALLLWPKEGAVNVDFAENFLAKLKDLLLEMRPEKYHPSLQVAFGGRLFKMTQEYRAIIGDIAKTSLMVVGMVGLVVLIYFRRLRIGFLMTLAAGQGTLLALTAALLVIGYLTSQTAFLGAIVLGNGINYGLIFMARYLEERRERFLNVEEALAVGISRTWKPTFVSATTTSASFAALTLTSIQGFSQFGFIGSVGMFLCWCCTFFFLPAWLSLSERVSDSMRETKLTKIRHFNYWLLDPLSKWVLRREKNILKLGLAFSICCVGFLAWYLPNCLEYDFSRLKFKPSRTKNAWATQAQSQIATIFGGSTTPSVILAERADQVEAICQVIWEKDRAVGGGYVEDCKTLNNYIPKQQPEKLEVLSQMRELLESSALGFLNVEQKEAVEKFKSTLNLQPLTSENLPEKISRTFTDAQGQKGLMAFVYPKANLWDGKKLMVFADLIRKVELPAGEEISSSGEPVILADLLKAVVGQGPKITLLSLIFVVFLVWINFRRDLLGSAFMIISLLAGMLWLMGCLALLNIKLNFLNIMALPISFGVGVDYAVNIYQRYKQDGPGRLTQSLKNTGGVVALCSLTTMIGYSVLLLSRSQALVSFGLVALLGEFCCLAVALFCLPAYLLRRREKRAG